ncbi:two-partner secretion domain-containing protein, partial [Microbulbifer epialgicus]
MKTNKHSLKLKELTSAIKASHLAYLGMFAGLLSPQVYAGPTGGKITGGEGSIVYNDDLTTISQDTELLAIDWESFNLTKDETVRFDHNASHIVLNRILDSNASEIRGAIEADGHVILVNPRGVLFTETATVNVGALTASGLDINPSEFMNGEFIFQGVDGDGYYGNVINRGVINASSAVLLGKHVENVSINDSPGLISAELVVLAAGNKAALTFDAEGMIGVAITEEVAENKLGIDSAVINSGSIEAAKVVMEASISSDLFTAAVNNTGTIQARGIDTSEGKIRLVGSGGSVINSGNLNVSLLNDDSPDLSAQLEVVTTDSLVNTGSIEATNFSFSVGQKGEGSDNKLGDIEFTGTASITGGAGEDKYTLSSEQEFIRLGDAGQSFDVSKNENFDNAISFANIEAVDAGFADGVVDKLIGTSGVDEFSFNESGELEVHGLTFSNIGTVDAGSDNGIVDKLTTATQVDLTGTGKELINTGITFQNLDSVEFTSSITGIIAGSTGSDTFAIISSTELTANDIVFTGFNSKIDAGNNADATNADKLIGTDGVDEFEFNETGELEVHGLTFKNIETVDAGSDNGV